MLSRTDKSGSKCLPAPWTAAWTGKHSRALRALQQGAFLSLEALQARHPRQGVNMNKGALLLLLLCVTVAACTAADVHQEYYGGHTGVSKGYKGYTLGLRRLRPARFIARAVSKRPFNALRLHLGSSIRRYASQSQSQSQAFAVMNMLTGGLNTPLGHFTGTLIHTKNETKTQNQSQSHWVGRNASASNERLPDEEGSFTPYHPEASIESASEEDSSLELDTENEGLTESEHDSGSNESTGLYRAEHGPTMSRRRALHRASHKPAVIARNSSRRDAAVKI